jgi:hypothetical protein
MDYDILLAELQNRYQEVENVVNYLFRYYLKSEYFHSKRVPLVNAQPIQNDRADFQSQIEAVLEQIASIE